MCAIENMCSALNLAGQCLFDKTLQYDTILKAIQLHCAFVNKMSQ